MGTGRERGTAPPRYDDAFKAGAIRLVTEQKGLTREVAQEWGICIDTLKNRLKGAGVQHEQTDGQNRDARRQRELETEVRTLRKQPAKKDEVIDGLKNPWVYFRDHRG